jgi:hypothetical protein
MAGVDARNKKAPTRRASGLFSLFNERISG